MGPGEGDKPVRIGDIPKNLEQVNSLLQDITTKLNNLGTIPALRINSKPFDEVERNLEGISKFSKKWADTLIERHKNTKDIAKNLSDSRRTTETLLKREKELLEIEKKRGELGKKKTKELRDIREGLKFQKEKEQELEKSATQIDGKWTTIAKLIGQDLINGFDKLGRSILALGIDALVGSVQLFVKGFSAVYDLVDRTVKATGEFRQNIGATTKDMAELEKEGWQLEGAIRGLSHAGLGIGLKELSDATRGFGFVNKELSKFRTTSVVAGRALGIGSAAAGDLARQFYLAGDAGKDLDKNFMDVSRAANLAGVPVADFTKEIQSSSKFMASFGKKARQVFLDSAAYAKRYGLSVKSLEAFTDLTDTFEGAANAAAKMNAIFGTSINGLELMMENDPSKRLEMVRKALVGQGKTWDNLGIQERKFLAQTVGIAEDELQGVLTSKKTLKDFQAEKARAAKKEISDQKALQQAMLSTAQTINNWGATWDQVTRAIKPIIDDLIGKDFFGKLGGRIQTVVKYIENFVGIFRNNPQVKAFVAKIRQDFGGLFDIFRKNAQTTPEMFEKINTAISKAVNFVEMFYDFGKKALGVLVDWSPMILKTFGFLIDNADTILKFWAGFKIGGALISGANAFLGIMGSGSTVGGAALGLVRTLGVGLGPALSSAASALVGPLGFVAAIGAAGVAGYAFGTKLREWFPQIDKSVQGFMDEQSRTWDKLKAVFSEEERTRQVKAGEAELNYALAKAGSSVRVGAQASQQPTVVHLPAPAASYSPGPTSSNPAGGKPGAETINVNVSIDSQQVGRATVKRALSTQ